MIKKFLKSNKGKEMLEIIILTPITIWLIFYTFVRIYANMISSKTQTVASTYVRTIITQDTLYDGLCDVAKLVLDDGNDAVIASITVTDKNNGIPYTLSFSEDSTETTYFKRMFYKTNGKYQLNYNVSESFKSNYDNVSKAFARGNYVEIKVIEEISEWINRFTAITFYNPQTKQNITIDYFTPGIVSAVSKNIVIS